MNKEQITKLYKEMKQDAKIDKNNLDEECCTQTFLYVKWSKRLALAEANFRRAELALTTFKAGRMIEEKQQKTTISMAENKYRVSTSYSTLVKKKSNLQQIVELMKSSVYAMAHRRAMLDNLVRLHTSKYYNET